MRLTLLLLTLTTTTQAQWQLQQSNTTASLRGIHAVTPQIAWASGTEGTILRTEDGGQTWQHCTTPPNAEHLDFRGIQAFDNKTAIAMSSGKGDLARLYKPTDACKTWTLIFTNPDADGFWDTISLGRQVSGPTRLWIFGDPVNGRYRVFHSTDNAQSQFVSDETETLTSPSPTSGAFAASNSAFFVLPYGDEIPTGLPLPPPPPGSKRKDHYEMTQPPIEYFVTGGTGGAHLYIREPEWAYDFPLQVEWESIDIPLGDGTEASGAFSIARRSIDAGVIVGGDYKKPDLTDRTAAYADAAKKQWVPAKTTPHGYRSAVAYDPTTKSWLTVGPNGTDISTDDGRNWHPLNPLPGEAPDTAQHWNALSLPFAVGPKGRIGKLEPTALKP